MFEEGGPFNQTGEFYGLFSFDGVTEKEARVCWGSNFYDEIQYRTITVKSGIAGDEEVKTYKVLKGTPITIPACIYEKPQSDDSYFQKHSLSLNGDIGVNFYLELTAEELSTAKIHFEWFNKELDLTAADLEYNQELGLYKASCPVAVAEMTYDIIATLSVNGADVESNRYSVVRYANVILTDKDFINSYIEKIKAETGSDENFIELAKETYRVYKASKAYFED